MRVRSAGWSSQNNCIRAFDTVSSRSAVTRDWTSTGDNPRKATPNIAWSRSNDSGGSRLTIGRSRTTRPGPAVSKRYGCRQCCDFQPYLILSNPDPALSPAPIIWNISWRDLFRHSLTAPWRSRS